MLHNVMCLSLCRFRYETKFYVRKKKKKSKSIRLVILFQMTFLGILKCYRAQTFLLRLCRYGKSSLMQGFFFVHFASEASVEFFPVTREHAWWSPWKHRLEEFRRIRVQKNTNTPDRDSHYPNRDLQSFLRLYSRPGLCSS